MLVAPKPLRCSPVASAEVVVSEARGVNPEALLAVAVIQQGVRDAREGDPKRQRLVREQIAAGSLDGWIDVVCTHGRTADYFKRAVRGIVAES
jgi:hypothetical protein